MIPQNAVSVGSSDFGTEQACVRDRWMDDGKEKKDTLMKSKEWLNENRIEGDSSPHPGLWQLGGGGGGLEGRRVTGSIEE